MPSSDPSPAQFTTARVAVLSASAHDARLSVAHDLARKLSLPLISDDAAGTFELLLAVCDQRLELRETGPRAAGPILVDFVNGPVGFRRLSSGSRAQPIASAVGLRSGVTRVVDATAGLARDAFLLACLGCFVTAIERSAVLGALVQDGLARASTDGPTDLAPVLDRITFLTADARHWLAGLSESDKPDVVYLDPMYPPKTKTAKAKKEPRICRKLVGDDPDAAELSDIARRTARRRVVVKRHRHAPALGPEPDLRFAGKQVRYDVYLVQP